MVSFDTSFQLKQRVVAVSQSQKINYKIMLPQDIAVVNFKSLY